MKSATQTQLEQEHRAEPNGREQLLLDLSMMLRAKVQNLTDRPLYTSEKLTSERIGMRLDLTTLISDIRLALESTNNPTTEREAAMRSLFLRVQEQALDLHDQYYSLKEFEGSQVIVLDELVNTLRLVPQAFDDPSVLDEDVQEYGTEEAEELPEVQEGEELEVEDTRAEVPVEDLDPEVQENVKPEEE